MKPRPRLIRLDRPDHAGRAESPAAELPRLEFNGISRIFRSPENEYPQVLDNLDLAAAPGELICILGPSGCGKTTLLNIAAGFLAPDAGTVRVDGRTAGKPGPDRCVVFQEDALFPWLTVRENIAFGLEGKGLRRKEIRRCVDHFLSLVGLSAFAGLLPSEISGGMKQRVALARVLALDPRILLMDEPFGALDAQTRSEMQVLLLRLWDELGHTILFVTHDMVEAALLADRIIIMDRLPGRIREDIRVSLPRPRRRESDSFHRFLKQTARAMGHGG
ncbi:MAG: ABC transporter ATP-binding protein [Desulfococcus sp.]|nr:MAG: ABC transporter ATP-binding protein [Desulfococcus sp.]